MKVIVSIVVLLITISCHTTMRETNYVLKYRLDSTDSINSHELLDEVYCYKKGKCIYRIRYAHNGWQKIDSTYYLYDKNGILNSIQIFDVVSNKWRKNTEYSSNKRIILVDDKYGTLKLDKYNFLVPQQFKYVYCTESDYYQLLTKDKNTNSKNIFYCYSPNNPDYDYPLKRFYCINDTISSVITMANPILLLDSSSVTIDKDSLSYFSYYDKEQRIKRHSLLSEYGIPLKDSFLLSSIYIFEIGEILDHLIIEKVRKTTSSITMFVKSNNKSSYKSSLLDTKHIYQIDIYYNNKHITDICFKQDNRWINKQLLFEDCLLKEEISVIHDPIRKSIFTDTLKYTR